MRVHFSNLILIFLATNILVGLQFIPILRMKLWGKDEQFNQIGSGWPMHCTGTHGNIFPGEAVFNVG